MRNNQLLKFFYVMMLSICFAAFSNQYIWAQDVEITKPPSTNAQATPGGEVDTLITAANNSAKSLSDIAKTSANVINDITAMYADMEANIEAMCAKLMAEAKNNKEEVADKIKNIQDRIEKLKKLAQELEETVQKMQELRTKYMDALASKEDAEKAGECLKRIAQDRIKAAKFIEFVRSNSRTELAELLKRESPGSNVDVREVKDTNGLMAIFRIGKLTHCLSTKNQCGGKQYSISK